ncbi:MAG: bifunctional phosphopantothenoylcysteine decarboxylase/phosphopantothenate--cysteine ligase CoaBC [Gemmatimonadetes bacterium]|nr:bifunctional phosphopantothenoylcysteine decarboxylase/phosphopantothenate--cysteine ligase CoaBC [Gemmatimonadota bacterium]
MPGRVLHPRRPWEGRRIVLGVTGGVAAYKAVQLARDLTRLGAEVDAILTGGAQEFVRPLSFDAVTGRSTATELFSTEGAALHIKLGSEADVVCVAPATADLIARAAHGRADDLLTTTLLATRAPVLICPAMNDRMYSHPQTQANLRHLQEVLSYRVAGPGTGPLAAGEGSGPGRMLEPHEIVEEIGRALSEAGSPLRGKKVLITAGPTREAIDPVRFIGNRSSGRMGFALAAAAWRRGAHVKVVTGPVLLPVPYGVEVLNVETAREMLECVSEHLPEADVSVFASAVADYRPANPSEEKLKRAEVGPEMTLTFAENPDVAGETRTVRKAGSVSVGFALETRSLVENARAKLEAKGFDMIVANEAEEEGAGFDVDTNRVVLLGADGETEELPLLAKDEVAEVILDRVSEIVESSGEPGGEPDVEPGG